MDAQFGHNEMTARLGLLAEDARAALVRVASGEADSNAGWLAYGAALNEGRLQFHPEDDKGFGNWVRKILHPQVGGVEPKIPHDDERAAAMWAAANPEQFDAAKQSGGARTVRGIHAKWTEMNAEREAAEHRARAEAERAKAEIERKEAAEAKAKADAERAEAKARADSEAAALRAAKQAKDAAERKEAQERAAVAAKARAEAEARAKAEDAKAKAANVAAKKSDKNAKTANNKAKRSDKKAAKAKAGNAQSDDKSAHVSNNSGENEWYTPAQFVEAARAVLGGFDLDPASSAIANQTVRAARFFTAQDDGLKQEWPIGRIWMNPPYAQPLMGQFADRLAAEVRRGSEAVVLVNNATETAWFQAMAEECSAICFPKTRIKFLDPEGRPSGAPLQGQAIIYCGPAPEAFQEVFAPFGLVLFHG